MQVERARCWRSPETSSFVNSNIRNQEKSDYNFEYIASGSVIAEFGVVPMEEVGLMWLLVRGVASLCDHH